jgi:hypothetical protein
VLVGPCSSQPGPDVYRRLLELHGNVALKFNLLTLLLHVPEDSAQWDPMLVSKWFAAMPCWFDELTSTISPWIYNDIPAKSVSDDPQYSIFFVGPHAYYSRLFRGCENEFWPSSAFSTLESNLAFGCWLSLFLADVRKRFIWRLTEHDKVLQALEVDCFHHSIITDVCLGQGAVFGRSRNPPPPDHQSSKWGQPDMANQADLNQESAVQTISSKAVD